MADEDDPDSIAKSPPPEVKDPKLFFQIGDHQDKWSEFDERGVPTKNAKKKKPTKKEKDDLEQEHLNAKKSYLEYLKEVERWEQRKLDAEAALEKSDRIRWAFRRLGTEKNAPIEIESLEELLELLGHADRLTKSELRAAAKASEQIANDDGRLELDSLRTFTKEALPALLMEERLKLESIENFNPELLYSPRTWRRKLETDDSPKKKSSPRGGTSPRGGSSPRSKKKDSDGKSPRSKKDQDDSPKSPRGKKDPKDKKEKRDDEKGSKTLSSPRGKK